MRTYIYVTYYNQSFLKPETWKYCVPGISTSRTYWLFQPPRPSPPHILSLSWRASRNMSTLDAYILLNFTYRFSPPTLCEGTTLQLRHDTTPNFYYSFINSIPSNSFHPVPISRSPLNILHLF